MPLYKGYTSQSQGSHRSGKSEEKVKILKSQEKVRQFWYGPGNVEIHEKVGKKSGKMDLISIWSPHSKLRLLVSWCACSLCRWQETQENYVTHFYGIWHINDKSYFFLPNDHCKKYFASLWSIRTSCKGQNIIFSCCKKSVKIGIGQENVWKKSGNLNCWWPVGPLQVKNVEFDCSYDDGCFPVQYGHNVYWGIPSYQMSDLYVLRSIGISRGISYKQATMLSQWKISTMPT